MFTPNATARCDAALRLVEEIRLADGVIIGSPGYHGGVSGLVKNALDYVEDLRDDSSPYLEGRAVGLVATGAGWQGAVGTLWALRAIVHSLRGWPTPMGVAINTAESGVSKKLREQLETLAQQVVHFASHYSRQSAAAGNEARAPATLL
jgi:FMN reductase